MTKAYQQIGGYAVRWDELLIPQRAVFRRWAFEDSLRSISIEAFLEHDPDLVIARCIDDTLRLREDRTGVWITAWLDLQSVAGLRALTGLRTGQRCGLSLGTTYLPDDAQQEWRDGQCVLVIRKARIRNVSLVAVPATRSARCRLVGQSVLRPTRHGGVFTLPINAKGVSMKTRCFSQGETAIRGDLDPARVEFIRRALDRRQQTLVVQRAAMERLPRGSIAQRAEAILMRAADADLRKKRAKLAALVG